jgi:hypothetical protein
MLSYIYIYDLNFIIEAWLMFVADLKWKLSETMEISLQKSTEKQWNIFSQKKTHTQKIMIYQLL